MKNRGDAKVNPLDAEDIALLEMFETERWPFEKPLRFLVPL